MKVRIKGMGSKTVFPGSKGEPGSQVSGDLDSLFGVLGYLSLVIDVLVCRIVEISYVFVHGRCVASPMSEGQLGAMASLLPIRRTADGETPHSC